MLTFKGVGEYLEDLAALIDAPRLYSLNITLFNQILFDTPQSFQFISRTPRLKAHKKACLAFKNDVAAVVLSSPPNGTGYDKIEVKILCRESDWQVSSLEQVCNWCLPPLSALEDLYIYEDSKSPPDWRDNIENTLWLELLHPFSGVKNLYLSEKFGATYRACPGRARWEQNDGSFARPTEYFPGGTAAIGTCPGRNCEVHCCARALRPPYNRFPVGKRRSRRSMIGMFPPLSELCPINIWCRLCSTISFAPVGSSFW
jgi:hypothetical protein